MATLTPTLTLTSSDTSNDALALTVTDSLTVTQPQIDPSRKASNASGGAKIEIAETTSANKYVYIKHTGVQADGSTATTQNLVVYINDGSSRDVFRLEAGEFAFFPLLAANKVEVISGSTHQILVEYAYYTKG